MKQLRGSASRVFLDVALITIFITLLVLVVPVTIDNYNATKKCANAYLWLKSNSCRLAQSNLNISVLATSLCVIELIGAFISAYAARKNGLQGPAKDKQFGTAAELLVVANACVTLFLYLLPFLSRFTTAPGWHPFAHGDLTWCITTIVLSYSIMIQFFFDDLQPAATRAYKYAISALRPLLNSTLDAVLFGLKQCLAGLRHAGSYIQLHAAALANKALSYSQTLIGVINNGAARVSATARNGVAASNRSLSTMCGKFKSLLNHPVAQAVGKFLPTFIVTLATVFCKTCFALELFIVSYLMASILPTILKLAYNYASAELATLQTVNGTTVESQTKGQKTVAGAAMEHLILPLQDAGKQVVGLVAALVVLEFMRRTLQAALNLKASLTAILADPANAKIDKNMRAVFTKHGIEVGAEDHGSIYSEGDGDDELESESDDEHDSNGEDMVIVDM